MKNYSIWVDGVEKDKYPKLDKDINVDVLIIGGGITGVSTAYHLRNSNLNVCLVERNNIASGVSSKTTGKLTYLQNLIYTKLSKKYSEKTAKNYLHAQRDSISLVENIIKENNIDCNYTNQKSYLFASNEEEISKIKHEKELLKFMKIKVKEENITLDGKKTYAISVADTAYFHPVKYIKSLAKICQNSGVSIYENTKINNIINKDNTYICTTDNNTIKASKIILACHYPFFLFPFVFPLKGHLERSYISASKIAENMDVSGIDTVKNTTSFRYHQDKLNNYLIYLKGSHNLAVKYNVRENVNKLIKDLSVKNIKPEYIWSNIDIITNDYLPYIGRIEDNLFIGTGYNTWGMTNGSNAGLILSDLILGKKNKYEKLFDPKRDSFSICSITNDIFSSAKPFIENKLVKNKSFYSSRVLFTKRKGQDIAIYVDENNLEHIVYNKCPHLKCSLIFNEVEKSWDCPCHASRFDIDGHVIEGPSCYNISYKDN